MGRLTTAGLVSRIAGLASQAAILAAIGAGVELDAFYIALIGPTVVWVPLATALELLLSPTYLRARLRGEDAAADLRGRALWTYGLLGVAMGAAGWAIAPLAVKLSAPGASSLQLDIATDVARLLYAGLGVRLIASVAAALLIGAGGVLAATGSKAVNPVVMLVVALAVDDLSALWLGIASLAGDLMEAVILLVVLRVKEGPLLITRVMDLSVGGAGFWALFGSQVVVASVPAIDQAFVAGLGAGTLSVYVVAVRLFDAARSAVLVPNARLTVPEVELGDRSILRRAYLRTAIVGAGTTLAVAGLGPILVYLVFQNGQFSSADARSAVGVLLVLAPGLIPYAFGYVLPRRLVALGRSHAVFALSLLLVGLNIVLDIVLYRPFGAPGVAAATVASMGVAVFAQAALARRSTNGLRRA